MTSIQNAQRKKILSNPVDEFKKQWPAAHHSIDDLTSLQVQLCQLKKQQKKQQSLCRDISRKIGLAKKNNQPIDNILLHMQEQSSINKELNQTINDVSEKIIAYFIEQNTNNPSADLTAKLPPSRIHEKENHAHDKIEIKLLNDCTTFWEDYLNSNPASSLYHRPEWRTLIKKVFGHHSYYFYASIDGKVVGVLPLVRLKSKLFGDFMVSMPYFNSGGALANSLTIEQTLITHANKHADKLGVKHIEYRDDIPRENLFTRTEKVNMILALPNSFDKLQVTFSSKLRSQVKRAQRENAEIIFGNADCLDDFYYVFSRNMRDLGTPVYSKKFFKEILQAFPDNSKIIVIHLNGKPVSSAFLLGYRNHLEIPWASTIKEVNHLSINMVMYWEILKYAIDQKYQFFDFGRSSKDSGTFRFKQQWGAQPKQCYWHYWSALNVEPPKLNPNNPKYALAIKVWQKLPVSFTLLLGPSIVKNLP